MLLRIIHQRIRCLYQIVKGSLTASFELHFKTAGCSQSRNHRRSGKIDFTFGIFRQVLFHLLHYFVNGSILAVFPRFQDNGQFTACLIASYTRAATRYVLHISYIRVLFQILHRTIGHYTGTLQCSAFRQFQLHLKVSLVFGRQEAGRYQTVNNEDSDQHHSECAHQASGMFDYTADDAYVFMIADIQPFINLTEHDILFLSATGFQDKRAHHRTERQRHNRRKQYGYRNSDGKLAI